MTRPSQRALGLAGLLGSPMILVQEALSGFAVMPTTRLNAVLGLLFLVGWACCAVGLRRLRATGRGVAAAFVFGVQVIGLSLAAMQQVQDLIYAGATPQTFLYRICDMAWPLSVLFMIVVGGFTLAAGVLRGWRRWTPLACGLALPLLVGVGAAFGRTAGSVVFGLYTSVTWALLAIAVMRD